MRKIKVLVTLVMAFSIIMVFSGLAEARTYNPKHGPTYTVKGYYKKNGTYVHSYQRTYPNQTVWDNLYIP